MRGAWMAMALAGVLALVGGVRAEDVARPEHPRPQLRRDAWLNLNGHWQFRFDTEDRGVAEAWWTSTTDFDRRITVPFCWESRLSGIADPTGRKIGWYRRKVVVPEAWKGNQVWLHFQAVDWEARVWVNGKEVGHHEGGYTPFALDITSSAVPGKELTIVVRAKDVTDKETPIGKQVGAWYTSTSGIWQTVWLEARPARHIAAARMIPRHEREAWRLDVEVEAVGPDGPAQLELLSPDGSFPKQQATIDVKEGRGRVWTALEIPSAKPWSPEQPHLYDLDIRLAGATPGKPGVPADIVHGYFGLRTIALGRDESSPNQVILLNGQPIYLRGALDQSFNPEGIYTAPSDAFLRRDMEIARGLGLNFLRIHIKAEEPRRLYWADRLGVLLMEDMPCAWAHRARARRTWEATMRATIDRDRNHPSIVAWCLFNETWGLGGEAYKQDKATQEWVLGMWTEVKEKLDPSRLVEDNSPCLYDHVKTDINSWHFYIDDYEQARRHVDNMVRNTKPGSAMNYVPGRAQGDEPLLVSEYGGLGASGGDRDISWPFRYLTTLLRQHELIRGHVYTELTDVEWEHNGFVDYDRTPKEFGYDAFVPGMTVADLQGADFVGYDAPPILEVAPGDRFSLPVFISHFSQRRGTPVLRWRIVGTDDLGRAVTTEPRESPATWRPGQVTFQNPLAVQTPAGRPFVGALTLELIDGEKERIAANYVNLVVRPTAVGVVDEDTAPPAQSPRVEILGPRLAAVRFAPDDFAAFSSDSLPKDRPRRRGKLQAPGECEVRYDLALPAFIRDAGPTEVVLMVELATKAGDERLDWPARRNDLDYPQTQHRKHPGAVSVSLLGKELWRIDLPDDPADARGVLSYQQRDQHGAYGYLIQKKIDFARDAAFRERLRSADIVPLVFRAVGDAKEGRGGGHGLSIYGERLGRYPIDPALLIHTASDLVAPHAEIANREVAVNRMLDKAGSLPKPSAK